MPFTGIDLSEVKANIISLNYIIPKSFSEDLKDLILRILVGTGYYRLHFCFENFN